MYLYVHVLWEMIFEDISVKMKYFIFLDKYFEISKNKNYIMCENRNLKLLLSTARPCQILIFV